MNTDIVQILDRFCTQAAKERSLPESLAAGRKILALPPQEQRLVVLALFGCFEKGVADYFSSARWGVGNEALKHTETEWALDKLFQQLAGSPLPLTDDDFCAIIASNDGAPEHFDYLLTQMEQALAGRALSPTLKRLLKKVYQSTAGIYEGYPRSFDRAPIKAQMDRIDALLHPAAPRRRGKTAKTSRAGADGKPRKAIIQSVADLPKFWELKPPAPPVVTPKTVKLGAHAGAEFSGLGSKPGRIYEDGKFDRCDFDGGLLSPAPENDYFDPASRCTVRRVELTRCTVKYPIVGPAIFEDVTIDNLETKHGPLFIRGAAFKHVILKGNVGQIMIGPEASSMPVERNDRAVMEANREFYANVDWALDIREVRAKELSITSVPVDLVRYDPEHQAIVRLTCIRKRWAEIKKVFAGCVFLYSMRDLLEEPYCDGVVLCAPLRARKDRSAELIDVIKRMRTLGIADPV